MLIAIQPDDYPGKDGARESSSERWTALARAAGHEVRAVDVFKTDIIDQINGCDGFMWRHAHLPNHRAIARRLLPAIESQLGIAVYPDQRTCWHYDDKIAQFYLLQAAGIPIPRTWIFWDAESARAFVRDASFPLVLKLWSGAGSTNVRLLNNLAEAAAWIERLFGSGTRSLAEEPKLGLAEARKRLEDSARMAIKGEAPDPGFWWELHKNYFLVQEFLAGNPFDTRVTVIGHRAFGFRRFNREGDFRASGSGRIDHDPSGVAEDFVRLAFRTAQTLGTQSCAIDGLRRGAEPAIGEITYTYASWAVRDCPGHWELEGGAALGALTWRDGQMWPEEAQMADFLARLESRQRARA
jgi:hypothetical protein